MGLMEPLHAEPGQLIVTPHPMLLDGQRQVVWELRPGDSLYAILMRNVPELDGQPWAVSIGGVAVERHLWHCIYPKQGQIIEVRGGVGKSALATVALMALAWWAAAAMAALGTAGGTVFGLYGVAGYAAVGAVYIGGSMLINKVLTPKPAKMSGQQQDSVYSLSGARNQLRPYEPLPLLFGRVRITPDLLSKPYTWYEGNDQYLGMLLSAGINVGRVENFYNGDTLLSSYEGVRVFHAGYSQMSSQAIPLFSNADVIAGGQLLDTSTDPKHQPSAWIERTGSADTVKLIVGLEYQLYDKTSKGGDKNNTERVEIQYRETGASAWLTFGSYVLNSSKTKAYRAGFAKDVPRGTYDVRVRTAGLNTDGSGAQAAFTWTTLTSVQVDEADYTGIARTGVQLKATGQLNGSPDELRAIGYADPMPVWDGTNWLTQETSNPGAQILAYARGIRREGRLLGGMALSDAQIDIESLKAFSLHCAANGYSYNFYVKDARNHDQVLSAIALAGFGQITWAGGRLGVVWAAQDQPLSGVVNMATIKKGQFQVDYSLSNAADGIEYTYLDAATWETKTLRVPAPGVTTMLNPAQVTGEGVTTEEHAARLARWHLAQSLYQYKDISYSTDIEHLSYQRLSVLAMQHDMTQWGFGGRVVAAAKAGAVVTLTLDEPVPAPASGSAFIGLRIPGERVYRVLRVKAFAGETDTIELLDEWPSDAALPGASVGNPAHDTLWIYDFKPTPGLRVRVVSVEPESDLKGASVRVVAEGAEFWNYVLTGHYEPQPGGSQLQTKPIASNLKVTEQQIVQGDTVFTELTATFDVSGPVGNIIVQAAGPGQELQEVAQTTTRTATWRIPRADVYSVIVRPFAPDGTAGVAVSASYATAGADVPPVLVDLFDVHERSGGVRLYTWGWLGDTIQSPDFAGVEIRHIAGRVSAPDWNAMTPVGDTGYHTAAFEAVVPASGEWTFACRSRNSGGALSTQMRTVTRTLGNSLGEVIENIGDSIAQETIDRVNGDAAAILEAVNRAAQYTDDQIAAVNGLLEDIVGADEWNNVDTYPTGDFVRHNDLLWQAMSENTNVEPGTDGGATWKEIGNYVSVGDALAAAISLSHTNATEIQVQAGRIDSVIVRMPAGNGKVASEASVTTVADALATETQTRAQQIQSVQSSLVGKADTSAVQLLEGRVDTIDGKVTAQGQAITKVDAKLNTIGVNRIYNPNFLEPINDSWVSSHPMSVLKSERLGGNHLSTTPGAGYRWISSTAPANGQNTSVVDEITTVAATVNCDGRWKLTIQYRNAVGAVLAEYASPEYTSTTPEGGWVRRELTSGPAPGGTVLFTIGLQTWDTTTHARIAMPMAVLGSSIGPYTDNKGVIANAQAITTLNTRVTPLEAFASATTAVLAKMGGGGNLLENASFDNGTTGWWWLWSTLSVTLQKNLAGDTWRPQGVNSIGAYYGGIVPGASNVWQYFDMGIEGSERSFVPVKPGSDYIMSGYMSMHRGYAVAQYMIFFDRNGNNVGEYGTGDIVLGGDTPAPNPTINDLRRFHLKGKAPAGAARARLGYRFIVTGGSNDPHFWLHRPMFEEVPATQTEPSPWVAGPSPAQTASAIQTLSVNIDATTGKVNAVNGVYLDVNGYVSGTVSENNGVRSSFTVIADVFRVVSPTGGARTDFIDGSWRVHNAAGVKIVQIGKLD